MNVSRQLFGRSKQNNEVYPLNRNTSSLQSTKKASKIKQTIKNIIIETCKAIGKTLTAAVLTSIIVIVTDLIEVANESRPQFAVGGEWLMIICIFVGWIFIVNWILGKKESHSQK